MQLPYIDAGQLLIGDPQRLQLHVSLVSLLLFQALAFVNLKIGHKNSCRLISLVGYVDRARERKREREVPHACD